MSSEVSIPEEGRHVHFYPESSSPDGNLRAGRKHAAIITDVLLPGMVNLTVFGKLGVPVAMTSVQLVGIGEHEPTGRNYAKWMPYHYQKAADAKNAADTARLQAAVSETRCDGLGKE